VTSTARSEPEARWGGPRTILGLVLAGAAALRLVGVEYGLPYGNLLNPDEQNIVPRAWAIVHGGGLDPYPFFDYPSLMLYVLAPFQAWEGGPSYLAARLVAVAIGVAGVSAAWWLGERSYGVAAGGIAAVAVAVASVHVAYSRVSVTDILLTTLVTVVLGLLVTDRIELAGFVAGLAAATKYPGVLLLVPLVVVTWRQRKRLAGALGLMLGGFALGTPFAFAHVGEAWDDYVRVSRRAHEGWLGFEHDHAAPIAFGDRLWESLGPILVVAAIGLGVALARRKRADLVLASWTIAYYLSLMPIGAHFDRYVLPLVPALAVLAARFAAISVVLLLLLVVPLTWTVREARDLTRTDTRVAAVTRVEEAAGSAPVAIDPGLPDPQADLVRLELPAPWQPPDLQRDLARLRAVDIGPVYVWVNGSIADRVRADRDEYPRESAFYDALDRDAERVFRIDPGHGYSGPWTALYRLRPRR
jgi:4-amino-4-deoxy-L-arabinose transferase-like glycosyltransferase